MRMFLKMLIVCGTFLHSVTAFAQEAPADASPHGTVAVGVGVVPKYDGAAEVRALPFAVGDIRWRGIGLELRGAALRVDLVSDPRLSIGPVIGMRLPRDNASGPVALLPEIDTAVEAGGFVGYRFGGNAMGQGSVLMELSVVHDVTNTYDGLLATAGASYVAVRQPDFFLSFNLQTTWADKNYTRTYFGIEPADAVTSGLAAYRPGSGFRDVGAGLTGGYWFSRKFGVIGRVGASYLVGDAADSPIAEEGSKWQPTAGLALSYRF